MISDLIIWSDEHLIAVNKPPGLLTIPDGYKPELPHLVGLLKDKFGKVFIVHRLDKPTSGVIIFARSMLAHKNINIQFQKRSVSKVYHAIISGKPEWDRHTIDIPLLVNGDRKHRTVINREKGKSAKTDVKIIEPFRNYSLLEARPFSGYTH
ncbi:MAG: RluA family pseudouridine synthase [Anaerolineaceae bacterium]|nr:RluA family pseudouridine synthase [Anaerolineaceae bacterium]